MVAIIILTPLDAKTSHMYQNNIQKLTIFQLVTALLTGFFSANSHPTESSAVTNDGKLHLLMSLKIFFLYAICCQWVDSQHFLSGLSCYSFTFNLLYIISNYWAVIFMLERRVFSSLKDPLLFVRIKLALFKDLMDSFTNTVT